MKRYVTATGIFIATFLTLTACVYPPATVVSFSLADVPSSQMLLGIKGGENIFLVENAYDFYVTDIRGRIYLAQATAPLAFRLAQSLPLGGPGMGITLADGALYVGVAGEPFDEPTGRILRITTNLLSKEVVAEGIRGVNGVTSDWKGTIYFASGSLSPFDRDGYIGRLVTNESNTYEEGERVLDGLSSANGLHYDRAALFFTQTYKGAFIVDPNTRKDGTLFGKSRIVEGFDDITIDSKENVWVADQPNGFLKCFNRNDRTLFVIRAEGFGVASSCRIREDNGVEYMYVTEFKQSAKSKEPDGRGVLIIPLATLYEKIAEAEKQ